MPRTVRGEIAAEQRLGTIAASIAQAFHESYERQAPEFGYKTREASAVPWEDVPEDNKTLMIAVAQDLLDTGVIDPGRPGGV